MTALRRDGAPPPVRAVHLGLGSFFRAHQAWYTWRSADAGQWGVAAFSGRRRELAEALGAQGGLYTLVTRSADGDRHDVVTSLARAHAGDDADALLGYLADPAVQVVTTTVTEGGYLTRPGGGLAADDSRTDDELGRLRAGFAPTTAPGRLLAGLRARRAADAGPLTLVPCDNLPENGSVLAGVLHDLAERVDPALAAWVRENARCATTVVDRITPATTDDDVRAVAAATGVDDRAPVVTEPFSEWVIAGLNPTGAPDWASAGAQLVDDAAPFGERKLRLLNGAHSLMAYAGPARGHETVAEAVDDPVLCADVAAWWAEAGRHVARPEADVAAYTSTLLERFANPRTRHRLAQIAGDGSAKLTVRVLPVLRAERAAGRDAAACTRTLGAWVAHLRAGRDVADPLADRLIVAAQGPEPARAVLALLAEDVASDGAVVEAVAAHAEELSRG